MNISGCKILINKFNSSFHSKIAELNAYVGQATRLTKKKAARADKVNFIYADKTRYIYCKKNVSGVRR